MPQAAFPVRRTLLPCAVCLCLAVSGCAGSGHPTGGPLPAQALEGPPLALVAQYGDIRLEGDMDRTCMVGLGKLHVQSTTDAASAPMYCEARIDREPTEKGRIRGVLDCTDGLLMLFSLRNIGPDQGVGVAKAASGDPRMMVLFYHPSREEAERRFPGILADMEQAMRK